MRNAPAVSRRGLFGAGLRRALAARLDHPPPPSRPTARLNPVYDAPAVGGRLAPVAQAMVELADVTDGQQVLAAAAGNHELASAAIRRGASVAPSESVRFECPDATFEAVLGFFSVTSHRDPRGVANELKRVARPGAAIVLATWAEQPWARYETAYRHFFDFPELELTEHQLEESGMGYALVFARKP